MSEQRTIHAIKAVSATVRGALAAKPPATGRTLDALDQIASIVREQGTVAAASALADIEERMLRPIDPSEITWNVFRLFEASDSETDWTLWLAASLSPENGQSLSALMWRSLCDAIVCNSAPPQPHDDAHRIASLSDWQAARTVRLTSGSVFRERADAAFGRTDIVIDVPGLFVVLENKLDEGWHDGAGDPQAVRYRKFGLKHRALDQRLGLVLLTKRAAFELDDLCCDYVRVLYKDLARALRQNLRLELSGSATIASVLELWPALLTVAAIEQDLLGIDIGRWRKVAASWRAIEALNEVRDYLRNEVAR